MNGQFEFRVGIYLKMLFRELWNQFYKKWVISLSSAQSQFDKNVFLKQVAREPE
jgi:hypothetical protein